MTQECRTTPRNVSIGVLRASIKLAISPRISGLKGLSNVIIDFDDFDWESWIENFNQFALVPSTGIEPVLQD
jgi:hypothetical protein